jgi:hypothetical protein
VPHHAQCFKFCTFCTLSARCKKANMRVASFTSTPHIAMLSAVCAFVLRTSSSSQGHVVMPDRFQFVLHHGKFTASWEIYCIMGEWRVSSLSQISICIPSGCFLATKNDRVRHVRRSRPRWKHPRQLLSLVFAGAAHHCSTGELVTSQCCSCFGAEGRLSGRSKLSLASCLVTSPGGGNGSLVTSFGGGNGSLVTSLGGGSASLVPSLEDE